MIVVPRERPVIENLNSYYINVERLLEHYQGELGCGGAHFKAPSAEAIVFFDESSLIGGTFAGPGETETGRQGIRRLLASLPDFNFTVSIYAIEPDKVYFWCNLPIAEDLYRDLSSEFSDLEGLIKKMQAEMLTGYIDVAIDDGRENGLIFYYLGSIIGSSCSWGSCTLDDGRKNQQLLVEKSRNSRAVFHVKRVSLEKGMWLPDPSGASGAGPSIPSLELVGELLIVIRDTVTASRHIREDFDTLLKKKFVENAETYDFLDPFADEFHFSDGRVAFSGTADDEELVRGVYANVQELATDLAIWPQLRTGLKSWASKHESQLSRIGISL